MSRVTTAVVLQKIKVKLRKLDKTTNQKEIDSTRLKFEGLQSKYNAEIKKNRFESLDNVKCPTYNVINVDKKLDFLKSAIANTALTTAMCNSKREENMD